jgi:hypothetical protein
VLFVTSIKLIPYPHQLRQLPQIASLIAGNWGASNWASAVNFQLNRCRMYGLNVLFIGTNTGSKRSPSICTSFQAVGSLNEEFADLDSARI